MERPSLFAICFGALVLITLVAFLFLGAFHIQKQGQYAKDLETGLFNAAWDELVAVARQNDENLDTQAFWRIPDPAYPAFMSFVSREAQKSLSALDEAILEGATALPKEVVGINYVNERSVDLESVELLRIVDVLADSPASHAGICKDDGVLTINNVALTTLSKGADKEGFALVVNGLLRAKDGATLSLKRRGHNGKAQTLTIRLNGKSITVPSPTEIAEKWHTYSSSARDELLNLTKTADALSHERYTTLFGGRETAKGLAYATVNLSRSSYVFREQLFELDGECVGR